MASATHYHADYVSPYWAPTLVKLRQFGQHIFYRWTGPSGTLAAFRGRYSGNENVSADILMAADPRTLEAAPPEVLAAQAAPAAATSAKRCSVEVGASRKIGSSPAARQVVANSRHSSGG